MIVSMATCFGFLVMTLQNRHADRPALAQWAEAARAARRRSPSAWGATAVVAAVLVAAGGIGPAAAGSSLDLLKLQVFAKESIQAERSDYEGRTAAGGDITLSDFQIDGDLTSDRHVAFDRGQVRGVVTAPTVRLSKVFFSGTTRLDRQVLELASTKLDLISARLAALPGTSRAVSSVEDTPSGRVSVTKAIARQGVEVVDVSADQLISAGPGRSRFDLSGTATAQLVVRIHGASVRLRDVGFSMDGGLDPTRIVFFFPEATDIEISLSGDSVNADGTNLGIPGSIVAARADLRFAAAKITGQVFVRAISGVAGRPGGQVDRFTDTEQSSSTGADTFVASQILQLANDDRFDSLGAASGEARASLDQTRSRGASWMPWAHQARNGDARTCQLVCSSQP